MTQTANMRSFNHDTVSALSGSASGVAVVEVP